MADTSRRVTDAREGRTVQVAVVVIAAGVLLAAFVRVLCPEYASKLDDVTLTYFAVAAALLLLRDVKSFEFGAYKFEFERRLDQVAPR